MTSSAHVLEIKELVKRYSPDTVIGPVSINIDKGEFVSLLGPSGCGKTTILRCVAGFEEITQGSIILAGVDISDRPAHLRGVGLVFQNYALFPHLTVFDNVAFGLRMQGLERAQLEMRVLQYLDIVRLAGMAKRMPSELSGGQQQRVAIARSLVMQPEILLLDEPLSSLDQKLRLQMRSELKSIQRQTATTFIYVTHDQGEALAMSDRVIILSGGRIEQTGAPQEVYARPRSRFVADFIGASNIYTGSVLRQVASSTIEVETFSGHKLLATCHEGAQVGDVVWVCIRPENIERTDSAAKAGTDGSVTTWHGKLSEATYSGDRTELALSMASTRGENEAPLLLSFFVREPVAVGDHVTVSFPAAAAVAVRDMP